MGLEKICALKKHIDPSDSADISKRIEQCGIAESLLNADFIYEVFLSVNKFIMFAPVMIISQAARQPYVDGVKSPERFLSIR